MASYRRCRDEPSLGRDRAGAAVSGSRFVSWSDVLGLTIRDARFQDRYSAVVLAVARGGERVSSNLGNVRLKPGDVLLLEASGLRQPSAHNKDFLLINDLGNGNAPTRLGLAFTGGSSLCW